MDDATDRKADAEEREAKAEMAADKAASEIIKQADANGQPKIAPPAHPFKMVDGTAPSAPAPQEPTTMVPREQVAIFIISCSTPNTIADGDAKISGRSLALALDEMLAYMSGKCGTEPLQKLDDLDTLLGDALICMHYNLPASPEPPKPEDKEIAVIRRQVVAPSKPSVAINGIVRRIVPVEAVMQSLVNAIVMRSPVSTMHMCAVTMVDKDGKVGGTVISNPALAPSAEHATVLYETMKNHAEEFKRNCEKQGLRLNSLIIPSAVQIENVKRGKAVRK